MTETKKINYFYIDESGSINNDSSMFIHGCIKTDSPNTISEALIKLKEDLVDSLYYSDFSERIKKEGFHATENNLDMRADVYKLLPLLDYRAYFVILNKETDYFIELKNKFEEYEIFYLTLKRLLHDRIIKNKDAKNIFIFETIQISKRTLNAILTEFFAEYDSLYDCEYKVVGKEEENMGVIDYLNFIFYHVFTDAEPMKRMYQNFDLVVPKIGVISILHNDVYLSRKKKTKYKVSLDNLNREIGGNSG